MIPLLPCPPHLGTAARKKIEIHPGVQARKKMPPEGAESEEAIKMPRSRGLLILPAGILARRLVWSWPCAVGMPFMLPVFLSALLNSTFVTLRPGGIRWLDMFYPPAILRSGNVR